MLKRPTNGDPYLSELVAVLNAELSRKEPLVIGVTYSGADLIVRYRAPYGVGWIQAHVQTSATGGMTYDAATYVSSTLVDCRADRMQTLTVTTTASLAYAIFLIPVQYDGAGTKVLYNGLGGRADAMATVTTVGRAGAVTMGALTATTGAFSGDVTLDNGAFYKSKRNTGSLAISLIGHESGTDRVLLMTTGDWVLRNGSLTELLKVTTAGALTAAASVTASGGALTTTHATNPNVYLNKTGATAREAFVEITGDTFRLYYEGAAALSFDTSRNATLAAGLVVGTTTKLHDITYTWPATQTANYVLSTDGSGNLSWVTQTTGGVGTLDGSGTANTIPKFTAATTLSNSSVTDNGSLVSVANDLTLTTGHVYQINSVSVLSATTLGSSVVTSSLTSLGTQAAHLIFTDNTYDIGASGATRPRTLYLGTSAIAPLFQGPILQSGSATDLLLKYNTTTKVTIGTSGVTLVDGITATTGHFDGLLTADLGLTVTSGQTLTVTGATITGLTAASVGAGTFPSGAFSFTTSVASPYFYGAVVDSNAASDLLLKRNGTTKITAGATAATFADAIVAATRSDIAFAYGMFSDSTTQAIANVANSQVVTFNTDVYKAGITHSTVTNPSRITVDAAGTYLITFSGIADIASGAVNKHIELWLAVDGSPVAASNTRVEIGSASLEMTVAVSFIQTFTAGQYFEIITWGDATTVRWLAAAAGTSPTRPAVPSVIVTVNKISK